MALCNRVLLSYAFGVGAPMRCELSVSQLTRLWKRCWQLYLLGRLSTFLSSKSLCYTSNIQSNLWKLFGMTDCLLLFIWDLRVSIWQCQCTCVAFSGSFKQCCLASWLLLSQLMLCIALHVELYTNWWN